MNKLKLFLENFIIYGLGGAISKIVPLIMLPIVTRLMPNATYYGISDMSNTLVSFGSAIALMGMYDAMYRMFFDKDNEEYKKDVCSTALIFTLITSAIIFILMLIMKQSLSQVFFGNKKYAYVVYLSAMATLVGATNSIVSAPTRMQNQRKIYLIANIVSPVLSYGIAIPLLLKGHYVIALPISGVLAGVTVEAVFGILNAKWFSVKRFDWQILKKLLIIAVPLMPNFIIYWVFNSCDRIMITNMLGVDAAGVYSIGSKLGLASQLIYTAFAGGWQYFAFSTMKEDNQVKTNSLIYEYMGIISFACTSVICAISYVVYDILFEQEYITGYIIAPYLFMAPLLQMLYQIGNNQFLIIKKTWPGMFILSSGAVVNILLNRILIPLMGIEGAAVSTLLGYVATCLIDIVVLMKCKLMKPSFRFLIAVFVEIIYFVLWRMLFPKNLVLGMIAALITMACFIILYIKDIKTLITSIKQGGNK